MAKFGQFGFIFFLQCYSSSSRISSENTNTILTKDAIGWADSHLCVRPMALMSLIPSVPRDSCVQQNLDAYALWISALSYEYNFMTPGLPSRTRVIANFKIPLLSQLFYSSLFQRSPPHPPTLSLPLIFFSALFMSFDFNSSECLTHLFNAVWLFQAVRGTSHSLNCLGSNRRTWIWMRGLW